MENMVLKVIVIDLSSREDSKNGQCCTFMTGSLFKNHENMGKLRLETPQRLSGYAIRMLGKHGSHFVVFHTESVGNAPNTLEKSQIFFSLITSEKVIKKTGNMPSKIPLD